MFNIHKSKITFALVAGAMALSTSAFAGSITETSLTWKPGFTLDDSTNRFQRIVHVDEDTGYKSGSTRVMKTTYSHTYQPGAMLDEEGYMIQAITFDPSQLATAADRKDDMRPKVLNRAAPNYLLDDDDHRYHLAY